MDRTSPVARSTIKVWVIEDAPHYREGLVRLLEEVSDLKCAGAFATCEDMLGALKMLDASLPPDVALMDIELKGGTVDGIEGITLLKDRLPDVAVVMYTIHDTAERIFAALRAGASGYLTKPAPVDHMVKAIREAHRGGMPMPPPVARKVRHFFSGPDHDYDLTERELEILTWMEKGAKQKEIAAALYLSHHTVDSHLRNIYQKLHVRSGIQAVAKAIRERLI